MDDEPSDESLKLDAFNLRSSHYGAGTYHMNYHVPFDQDSIRNDLNDHRKLISEGERLQGEDVQNRLLRLKQNVQKLEKMSQLQDTRLHLPEKLTHVRQIEEHPVINWQQPIVAFGKRTRKKSQTRRKKNRKSRKNRSRKSRRNSRIIKRRRRRSHVFSFE